MLTPEDVSIITQMVTHPGAFIETYSPFLRTFLKGELYFKGTPKGRAVLKISRKQIKRLFEHGLLAVHVNISTNYWMYVVYKPHLQKFEVFKELATQIAVGSI